MNEALARRLLTWLGAREPRAGGAAGAAGRSRIAVDRPCRPTGAFAILADELVELDYDVRRVPGFGVGNHLYARPRARRRHGRFQLVLGHMDTVWPLGTLAEMPVRRAGEDSSAPARTT